MDELTLFGGRIAPKDDLTFPPSKGKEWESIVWA